MKYRLQRVFPQGYAVWRKEHGSDVLIAICRNKHQAERWIATETGQNGLQGENSQR